MNDVIFRCENCKCPMDAAFDRRGSSLPCPQCEHSCTVPYPGGIESADVGVEMLGNFYPNNLPHVTAQELRWVQLAISRGVFRGMWRFALPFVVFYFLTVLMN